MAASVLEIYIDGEKVLLYFNDFEMTWGACMELTQNTSAGFSVDENGYVLYQNKFLVKEGSTQYITTSDYINTVDDSYQTVKPAKHGAYIGVDTPTEAGYDAFYATTDEFLADYPLAEPYVMVFETCPSMDVDSGLYLPTSPAIDQFQTQRWCSEIWMDFPWAMAGSETVEIDGETRYAYVECYHVDEATLGVYVYNGNYPPVENPSEPVYKGIARKIKKIYVGVPNTIITSLGSQPEPTNDYSGVAYYGTSSLGNITVNADGTFTCAGDEQQKIFYGDTTHYIVTDTLNDASALPTTAGAQKGRYIVQANWNDNAMALYLYYYDINSVNVQSSGSTARKVKKAYIGVGGVARLCWTQPTIVTISGTGDETYCYVDINGIKYSSAATVEVDIGSEISIFVSSGSRPGQRNCYIALNGVNVQDGAGNYIHIVDTSCNVSLHCDVFGSAEITTT